MKSQAMHNLELIENALRDEYNLELTSKDFFVDGTVGTAFEIFGSEIVFRIFEDKPQSVHLSRYRAPQKGLQNQFRGIDWFASFLARNQKRFGVTTLKGFIDKDRVTFGYYQKRGAVISEPKPGALLHRVSIPLAALALSS